MNEIVLNIRDRVAKPYAATAEGKDCCRTSGTTSTREFIDSLRDAKPEQRLIFQLDEVQLVAAGYHVTEVKVVSYNTMECGGMADNWLETVIQLWNPGDESKPEYMTTEKFLAIYDRVTAHIPVSDDAELRFEYGDSEHPACNYHVALLETHGELLVVNLRAPMVTCKARDRKNTARNVVEGSCCGQITNNATDCANNKR